MLDSDMMKNPNTRSVGFAFEGKNILESLQNDVITVNVAREQIKVESQQWSVLTVQQSGD